MYYRLECSTYLNFKWMYDTVYGLLEKYEYIRKLDKPKFYDLSGLECSKDKSFGSPVEYEFVCPDLVLVADKTGTNTKMANDKVSGGNKRVVKKGLNYKIPSCNIDCHFTTMGFTALDGTPVCCAVILQKDGKLTWTERHGFDINANKGCLMLPDLIQTKQPEFQAPVPVWL